MFSRSLLQYLAVGIVVCGLGLWIATGASQGWTQTRVMVRTLDPVTGIEGITYRAKFVPGVDFLAVSLAAGFFVWAVPIMFLRRPVDQPNTVSTLTKNQNH
jgi:hypothetical protein